MAVNGVIEIKEGLDVPIEGGVVQYEIEKLPTPKRVAYNFNFRAFEEIQFRLLVEEGDEVKIGQPLAEDKNVQGRMFVSPAGGVIEEIKRGEKRKLLAIIIKVADSEEGVEHPSIDLQTISKEKLIEQMLQGGLFVHIRTRPFYRLVEPQKKPRAVFIKAIETAPFTVPPEVQIKGREKEFITGIEALKKLYDVPLYVMCKQGSSISNLEIDTYEVKGPHPAGNSSVHIQSLCPIEGPFDSIWTLTTLGVLHIGSFILHGRLALERIISVAGPGIQEEKRSYLNVRFGHAVGEIVQGRLKEEGAVRLISGDILTGDKVEASDFLGFSHTSLCALFEEEKREPLHFFRLGFDRYTASRTYLSALVKKLFPFTTSQRGEKRMYLDARIYDKVMPLNVLPVPLLRAAIGGDYDLAAEYGLLEIAPEDFALLEFICPSKIEWMGIIRAALRQYYRDLYY